MPPFLQFVIRRFLAIPISLVIITIVLYGGVMLTPPEARAALYYPPNMNSNLSEERMQQFQEQIIRRYHLRDAFPVQYGYWVKSLFDGTWGYSPAMDEFVLPALVRRTPITLELAIYSLLLLIPLGLVSGVIAGWKRSGTFDRLFRGVAFLSTSTPSFILALFLLSIFYIQLGWFAPGRISTSYGFEISRETFRQVTGLLTVDSLLNGRPDIFLDAWKHLAMPVFTLSLYHWATLGRIARASMINERGKEYILSARARGLSERRVVWHHAFYNMLAPSLTSIALSATSIITGVFVTEIIFNFNGVSRIIIAAMSGIPDASAALGFAIYSVLMVLILMFLLDVLQAVLDPRIREGVLKS
ncbi:MAG TPA: ABC transporter permease [Anaerolineales bacterium]|nr:ABC transporter permease [Anaerolineales bacterium]